MPRSGRIKKRALSPDPIYSDRQVALLINKVMEDGKKAIARKHVYKSFKIIKKKLKKEPLEVFKKALGNIKPSVEVRSRRVGGAAYQVPMPIKGRRGQSLAIRWLVEASRSRDNKEYHSFTEKLAAEIIDAFKREGGAIDKRRNVHRMAEANKAFAHFRW